MSTLTENIARAVNDFDTIKAAIINKGVEIPTNTPTSQYGTKIEEISSGGGANCIKVTVSLEDGTKLEGQLVTAVNSTDSVTYSAVADANGFALLEDLTIGDYVVSVNDREGYGTPKPFKLAFAEGDVRNIALTFTMYVVPDVSLTYAQDGSSACFDSNGNAWIGGGTSGDYIRGFVSKILPDGTEIVCRSSPYRGLFTFVADNDGSVWCICGTSTNSPFTASDAITIYNEDGTTSSLTHPEKTWLAKATSDPLGNVWIAGDTNVIYKYSNKTDAPTTYTLPAATTVSNMCSDKEGNIWVTIMNATKVFRIGTSGEISEFSLTYRKVDRTQMTCDNAGNLWILSDDATVRVQKISPDGTLTGVTAGIRGAGPASNATFSGHLDSKGRVWFTMLGNAYSPAQYNNKLIAVIYSSETEFEVVVMNDTYRNGWATCMDAKNCALWVAGGRNGSGTALTTVSIYQAKE